MFTETNNTIGQRVKSYRRHLGLSQDELADGICSRQTISILENDQHIPSADILQKIAARLGIHLQEIMNDHVRNLEVKVQIDIINAYIESGQYNAAFPLIEELEHRDDLLKFQLQEIVLAKADCHLRTGSAEQAIEILSELQQDREMDRESDDYFMATLYDKLGTAFYYLSNLTNAHAHYFRAYQLTLRFPKFDLTAARIAYNLGMTCRHLNRQSDAIQFLSLAESFFKDASDIKRLAHTFFELGVAHSMNREYGQADRCLQDSLAIYKSLNVVNMARLARQVHALAVLSHKHPEEAIAELQECAVEYEKVGDSIRAIFTYAHLANVMIRNSRLSEAEHYLKNAISRFTAAEAEKDSRLVFVYQVNAMYFFEIKDYQKCIEYSLKSSELFDKMGLERDAADSLNLSAKAYHGLGILDLAYELSQQVNEKLCRLQDHFSKRLEVF